MKRFRSTQAEIYGQRLERVILHSSRARGDTRDQSDYDIAVFLRDYTPGTSTELYRWPTSAPPYLTKRTPSFTPCLILRVSEVMNAYR